MSSKPVSDLDAAQLSDAAYTTYGDWTAGHGPNGKDLPTLPDGWYFDPLHSSYGTKDGKVDTNNQFITFYNPSTEQVMVVFKGTDNLSNWYSDFTDAGYSEWKSLQPAFENAISD